MANYLRYANQGATRNQPLDPKLVQALAFLAPMGITAEVFSGGQPGKGSGLARVGSVRHDHGNAGDMRFYKDGKPLSWANPQDLPIFQDIVRKGKQAGVTGFGAGPGYMGEGTMHVGFGSPGVWGAGGKGANAPEWLRNAFYSGSGADTAVGSAGVDPISPAPPDPYASMPDGPKGQEVFQPVLGSMAIGATPQPRRQVPGGVIADAFADETKGNLLQRLAGLGGAFDAARQPAQSGLPMPRLTAEAAQALIQQSLNPRALANAMRKRRA